MRSNAYCGNLLWQSSLTLQAPEKRVYFWKPHADHEPGFVSRADALKKGSSGISVGHFRPPEL